MIPLIALTDQAELPREVDRCLRLKAVNDFSVFTVKKHEFDTSRTDINACEFDRDSCDFRRGRAVFTCRAKNY
jgi:hypothetical protein